MPTFSAAGTPLNIAAYLVHTACQQNEGWRYTSLQYAKEQAAGDQTGVVEAGSVEEEHYAPYHDVASRISGEVEFLEEVAMDR